MFNNFQIKNTTTLTTEAIKFIKKNHYSKSSSRGNKFTFLLYVCGKLRGVATFGTPVGKKSPGDLECKRFCLAPNAKKNVASWFMAKCIKEIKKTKQYSTIVSYADPEQGHEGTLYKASNYFYAGEQKNKGQVIVFNSGQEVHLRAAYQKINGQYTKTAQFVHKSLQNGTAKYKFLAKKKIFTYNLKK